MVSILAAAQMQLSSEEVFVGNSLSKFRAKYPIVLIFLVRDLSKKN